MKKFILITTLLLGSLPAFAQQQNAEAPLMTAEEYSQITPASPDLNASDEKRPAPYQEWVCYANNPQGQYFRAYDWIPQRGQERAMQLCFYYSRLCRADGCFRR